MEKLYQLCDTMVAPEYRPLIRPFLDVSTLSARLKTEECISTEYRMCDGSWHRMLFHCKKTGMIWKCDPCLMYGPQYQ